MNITTIIEKMNMTYKRYNKQPMQSIELNLHMNIAKAPQLINSLDRYNNHPLIRKYSRIPFNI